MQIFCYVTLSYHIIVTINQICTKSVPPRRQLLESAVVILNTPRCAWPLPVEVTMAWSTVNPLRRDPRVTRRRMTDLHRPAVSPSVRRLRGPINTKWRPDWLTRRLAGWLAAWWSRHYSSGRRVAIEFQSFRTSESGPASQPVRPFDGRVQFTVDQMARDRPIILLPLGLNWYVVPRGHHGVSDGVNERVVSRWVVVLLLLLLAHVSLNVSCHSVTETHGYCWPIARALMAAHSGL